MPQALFVLAGLVGVLLLTSVVALPSHSAPGTTLLDLGGNEWSVVSGNGSVRVPAIVPGTIHLDLRNAGVIGDPYYRYNDVAYRWVAFTDWSYSRRFAVPEDLLSHTEVALVCEGLDTVAQVSINGKVIGHTDNMFRRYLFTVPKGLLRADQSNTITISFVSAPLYAKEMAAKSPYEIPFSDDLVHQSGEPFRHFIRKEQCSFSWDWGPAFMPQGIWKPIHLVGFSVPLITAMVPQVIGVGAPNSGNFLVEVETVLLMPSGAPRLSGTLKVSVPGLSSQDLPCQLQTGENRLHSTLEVSNANLWWPVGYGSQPLYTLEATFTSSQLSQPVSDTRTVGFRVAELVTSPEKYSNKTGSPMYFRVNGVPIFAKGSNFVPMDSFENKITKEDLLRLVQSTLDANMNIIRVWGGGIYQHDEFYNLCDEKGIMVWQEFMFACAMYPRDSEFLATTAAEVTHQVQRLAHHPSVILWSGNNENEAAFDWFEPSRNNPRLYAADYAKLYFDTIRETLIKIDRSRQFWPSSPSNGFYEEDPFVGIWGNPYEMTMGDLHFYSYDADCTNVSKFPSPRFASEYGYQSLPSLETWRSVSEADLGDWHPLSPLMQHRQHKADGNNFILTQIQYYFRYNITSTIQSFKDWIYLSQCIQAMCIKAQSEHYRRGKGMEAHTMGAIYWQLNDIWQAPTWSSLEYGGRWKLLHYYVKQFFAPVLVSVFEEPLDALQVHITSDINKALSGTLYSRLWSWNSPKALEEWKIAFSLGSLSSKAIWSNSISSLIAKRCKQREDCFLTFSALEESSGSEIASNHFFLARPVKSSLPRAQISVRVAPGNSSNEAVVMLLSDNAAPFVWLETALSGRFEDNGLLLLPRSIKQVTFYGWKPFDMAALARDVQANLRSLRDVY